jgi:uncharacterized repeat protein (TIGR03803 family)
MKNQPKTRLFRHVLAALGFILAGRAPAQTFANLHGFTAVMTHTNGDGANPSCSLVFDGNLLYGTTEDGGTNGTGTVFALDPVSRELTDLYAFSAAGPNSLGFDTNRDGVSPAANLILSGNTLYGAAEYGGTNGVGTIFSIHTDGTAFTNLFTFSAAATNSLGHYTNGSGTGPQCGLVLAGNTLFGTASGGGSAGNGTVFRVNTDGTGFTNLHSFTYSSTGFPATNGDGYYPQAGLVLSGNALYGTAVYGGVYGRGSVFKVSTDGMVFTNLHSFTSITSGTNSDGALPFPGLVLSGNMLYGLATYGGSKGDGVVFAIYPDGSGFTNLYNFQGYPRDGGNPQGALIVSGHTLYGTTQFGGSADTGTIFRGNTDGSGFTNLYRFSAPLGSYPDYYNSDGYYPVGALIMSGNTLYGTTLEGGAAGLGAVFSLTLPLPQLSIVHSGTNIILTWPTNATGLALEFTTNLAPTAHWATNPAAPVILHGQYALTNSTSGQQKFYRLIQ